MAVYRAYRASLACHPVRLARGRFQTWWDKFYHSRRAVDIRKQFTRTTVGRLSSRAVRENDAPPSLMPQIKTAAASRARGLSIFRESKPCEGSFTEIARVACPAKEQNDLWISPIESDKRQEFRRPSNRKGLHAGQKGYFRGHSSSAVHLPLHRLSGADVPLLCQHR